MGRHFIIVDDKHADDGYRREEMYRRMNGGYRNDGYRMHEGSKEKEYDELASYARLSRTVYVVNNGVGV